MAATWWFAPLGGGEVQGFNDPGIEEFKDNPERSLVREGIQNSLDAVFDKDQPVRVSIDVFDQATADIPAMDDLADVFGRCAKRWNKIGWVKEFLQRAAGLAKKPTVKCLQFSDFNTRGLCGSDTDQEESWFNLVRCSGASYKSPEAGGSYGLGKNAPFANSQMRTVFYSTLNADGGAIFQGVTRLATFNDKSGQETQKTGYCGGQGGCSVRAKKDIPKAFRRQVPGTDVFVLAFPADADWERRLVVAVLEWFWPAIHNKKLVVQVGHTTIDAESLTGLMSEYSTEEDFQAHLYYPGVFGEDALEFSESLKTLKDVSVRLHAGDPKLPKEVALVRQTGMVIRYRQFRCVVPFAGLFVCDNDQGNKVLRLMEPPRHDDWHPDRPEKNQNKKTEKEFADFIRACIKKLTPVSDEKTTAIPELSDYLPDDGDTADDAADGPPADGKSKHEGFDRHPKVQSIPSRELGQTPPTKPGGGKPGEGDAGSGDADDEGDSGGDSNQGGGGNKGSKGGGGDEDGDAGGTEGRTPVVVKSRAFLRDLEKAVYSLSVQTPKPRPKGQVFLSVTAVGDDLLAPIDLKSARQGAKVLKIEKPNRVGPVTFPRSGPLKLDVMLAEPRKLSLQVTAHEGTSDEAE